MLIMVRQRAVAGSIQLPPSLHLFFFFVCCRIGFASRPPSPFGVSVCVAARPSLALPTDLALRGLLLLLILFWVKSLLPLVSLPLLWFLLPPCSSVPYLPLTPFDFWFFLWFLCRRSLLHDCLFALLFFFSVWCCSCCS
ncbi:hypothetical protein DFJ73DRAFT_586728 [Zopfochytrium polystomum]|nr:hypothetical protein DFJ73DRAFT_586728 [Zopfochytrium polystomum]